jgi:hypothetical protein
VRLVIVASESGLFSVEDVLAELEHLARLAANVLNEHTNAAGSCNVCGSTFPCGPAVLAEHNLALL